MTAEFYGRDRTSIRTDQPHFSSCGQTAGGIHSESLIRVIEVKQLERIAFHYTALDGKYKELKIPVANCQQAERILANGERVDGSSLFRSMVGVDASDLYVVPVYRSAFLNPFHEPSLELT